MPSIQYVTGVDYEILPGKQIQQFMNIIHLKIDCLEDTFRDLIIDFNDKPYERVYR